MLLLFSLNSSVSGKKNQAAIREFIDDLFPCNISLFPYGNPLYPVLENCCASMIQYYLLVAKEFGHSNAVIHRMATVASAVNLSDASFPLLPSRLILLAKWSELLQKDVREMKMGEIAKCSGEVNSISSTLNQMAVVLGSLQADVRELKIHNGDQATTLTSQAAENVQLREENETLHQDYSKAREHGLRSNQQLKTLKLALSSCSFPSPALARKRARVEGTNNRVQGALFGNNTKNDDDVHSVLLTPVQEFPTQRSPTRVAPTAATSALSNTALSLVVGNNILGLDWNRDGEDKTRTTSSGKKKKNMLTGKAAGTDFAKIFLGLVTTNLLDCSKFASTRLPKNTDYKKLIEYCLELADLVTTKEQKVVLSGDDVDVQASTSKDIVMMMEKNIVEWNGYSWDTEKKLMKNGSSKKTSGVTGLFNQIVKHKQKCILRRGKTPWINGKGDIRYNDQPLVDLDTIENDTVRPVVPKNAIMTNFFTPNKKRDDADSNDDDNDNDDDDDDDDNDNDAGETERSNNTIDSSYFEID